MINNVVIEVPIVKSRCVYLLDTVGQKTVPMFGCFAKIELEQIEKIK